MGACVETETAATVIFTAFPEESMISSASGTAAYSVSMNGWWLAISMTANDLASCA